MAVNFWGVVNPTLAVLPQMRTRRSGRIVNITSIGGKLTMPHMLPYTCAKFAAVGFSHGLRAEVAADGISVTTVVPGLMRTGSYLHAEMGGNQEGEYRWFAVASSAPYPVTIGADRAARIIVRAARRGQAECTYPVSALLAARLAGPAPWRHRERAGDGRPAAAGATEPPREKRSRSDRRRAVSFGRPSRGDHARPRGSNAVQPGTIAIIAPSRFGLVAPQAGLARRPERAHLTAFWWCTDMVGGQREVFAEFPAGKTTGI